MYSNKTVQLLESLIEDVDDLVYYADPKRQMLDSKSAYIRIKRLKKNLRMNRARTWQSNTYSTPMPKKRSTER